MGAFRMAFRQAVYEDQPRFEPPIWRQSDGAIPQALAGLDAFSDSFPYLLQFHRKRRQPYQWKPASIDGPGGCETKPLSSQF